MNLPLFKFPCLETIGIIPPCSRISFFHSNKKNGFGFSDGDAVILAANAAASANEVILLHVCS